MENTGISVLLGRNDEKAFELGRRLVTGGAKVSYAPENVLHIQREVMKNTPDALILSGSTKYKDELCTLLRQSANTPMIVVISEGKTDYEAQDYADLVLDKTDRNAIVKLFSRLFGKNSAGSSQLESTQFGRLDRMIADALFELCITKNYNGYLYILEAIKLASQSGPISRGISKDIYPSIAAKFSVTPWCVERNIRTVIHSSWSKSAASVKREYFGPFTLDENWIPTNSEFIFIVADRLTLRMGGHI
jgi:two-component system response regulator (stage 0 sporulation protein A)